MEPVSGCRGGAETVGASANADERMFAEVKRFCYAGLDAPTLQRRALASHNCAVPFDGFCAHEADPASGLMMRMLTDPPDERRSRFFLEHVYFQDEINDFVGMIRARRPVALLSEATGGRLDRSLRYRAAIAPRGFHFDLRAVFASRNEHWGGVSLFRERGVGDFTSREVVLIQRLAPHLAAGLQSAALRVAAPESDDGPGVLVLDHRGRVVQCTATAERWLRELGELGSGWRDGAGLPDAVWLAVGALRHALNAAPGCDLPRIPCIAT